jgi:hypothetical protein
MRYTYYPNIFTDETALSFYFLGLYITDGNVYLKHGYEVSIKSIDVSLLHAIAKLVCPTKSLVKIKNSNCFKLSFNCQAIAEWLVSYGCVPNKTKIVKFPTIPEKYYPDLIRGLLDGDGSIGFYKSPMIRFDSASFHLINGVKDYLNSTLGFTLSLKETPWITTTINGQAASSTTQMYRLSIVNLNAYKLLKHIYYQPDCFSLDRKKAQAFEIINHYESRWSPDKLLSFNKLPIKDWPGDQELFNLVCSYHGSFKLTAQHLNVSAWGLVSRLRKIGYYQQLKTLYPVERAKNFNGFRKPKMVSESLIQEIDSLFEHLTHRQIAEKFSLKESYVAFLKRDSNKRNVIDHEQ